MQTIFNKNSWTDRLNYFACGTFCTIKSRGRFKKIHIVLDPDNLILYTGDHATALRIACENFNYPKIIKRGNNTYVGEINEVVHDLLLDMYVVNDMYAFDSQDEAIQKARDLCEKN